MAEQFYTIPTAIGKAKIANSIALGAKVNLKTMKIGDSNGIYYNPSESQTDLVHTVYSCEINSVEIDESNSNWINVVCAIPADVGDFFIREVGIFDDNNDLIAIGKYPETYKPLASNGSTKELYIKMTFEVTNVSSVTLKIDPTVILATKNDINILTNSISSINAQLSDMVHDSYPTVIATGTNSYVGSTDKIKALGKGITKLTLFVGTDATGNCSLNLNSYGAKNIKDSFGNIVNNFKKDIPYNLCYNGTDFILQGKGGGGDALASQLLINKKATVDTGPIVGTMPDNGAINQALPINGSYTIPKGYHDGTGKVTQSVLTKAGTTINPSTSQQVIPAGQYLAGDQIIAAIIGTATDADVVAGKTYNSAAGILRTGTASIASLGGKQYYRTNVTIPTTYAGVWCPGFASYNLKLDIGFKPSIVLMYRTSQNNVTSKDVNAIIAYDNMQHVYLTSGPTAGYSSIGGAPTPQNGGPGIQIDSTSVYVFDNLYDKTAGYNYDIIVFG